MYARTVKGGIYTNTHGDQWAICAYASPLRELPGDEPGDMSAWTWLESFGVWVQPVGIGAPQTVRDGIGAPRTRRDVTLTVLADTILPTDTLWAIGDHAAMTLRWDTGEE